MTHTDEEYDSAINDMLFDGCGASDSMWRGIERHVDRMAQRHGLRLRKLRATKASHDLVEEGYVASLGLYQLTRRTRRGRVTVVYGWYQDDTFGTSLLELVDHILTLEIDEAGLTEHYESATPPYHWEPYFCRVIDQA